ncbi:S24 family peptidase [Salipiger sp. H15]|uniref:S24 family peptidase n=1 Tax=Alloyangia sp. H15 TaxID=3029062 RepID=A0AAU8AF30_9RHOB
MSAARTDKLRWNMLSRTPISTPLHAWLNKALEFSGLSQTALAEKLDAVVPKKVDRSTINKMVLGKRAISAEELLRISEITGFAVPGETPMTPTIAIAGRVGAGAQVPVFDAYSKGAGPQVECPPGLSPHGVVAVEVEGDSMEPVYSAGDLLFYTREAHDGVPAQVIGHRCVVEDENGMGWVKQVKPGDEPGLFHLISLNPGANTMWNKRLKWAARVRLHWPAELARRV